MNHPLLTKNEKKKLDLPLWMLICFAMFCFWQMGFIYFIGPSLTVNGKTPLPISMDNATALIVVCYILSIIWMIFLPRFVVRTQQVATAIALATTVGLFMPIPDDALRLLIYIQIFCCCLMIGFETFIMVNYFSEKTNIYHLTAAYGVSLFMIAILQNEFIPISFPPFRVILVVVLVLLLIFFMRMPTDRDAQPDYVKKADGITAPKKLLLGTYIFVFICSLMGVSGPAISGEMEHGVSITYLFDAITSFVLYICYKKFRIHPFKAIPALVGLGCMGFILIFASTRISVLSYAGCGLIGIGMLPCQMLPLYGATIMKSYPSKYISPIIIGLALLAVLVQSSMVEIFRGAPDMLYLSYAIIMAVLVIFYMQIEPFLLFTLRRKTTDESAVAESDYHKESSLQDTVAEEENTASPVAQPEPGENPLDILSKREMEVVDLICLGYSNADIAKMLFISVHTVKDHTKKIYPKMGVHSRFELAALVSKLKEEK